MVAESLAYVDTELSADCIEFCPFDGFQNFFVCGTYQVLAPVVDKDTEGNDEETDDEAGPSSGPPAQTRRTGRLLLFRVSEDETSV